MNMYVITVQKSKIASANIMSHTAQDPTYIIQPKLKVLYSLQFIPAHVGGNLNRPFQDLPKMIFCEFIMTEVKFYDLGSLSKIL